MNLAQPTAAQQQLLNFINPTDAPGISKAFRNVFNMALFDNSNVVNCQNKDDLFYLEKTIQLIEKM